MREGSKELVSRIRSPVPQLLTLLTQCLHPLSRVVARFNFRQIFGRPGQIEEC